MNILKMLAFEESVFLNKAKMMLTVVNRLIPEYVCRLFERRPVDSLNMSLRSISNCNQGPVVQSIVSLTSSLTGQLVKCFTTL